MDLIPDCYRVAIYQTCWVNLYFDPVLLYSPINLDIAAEFSMNCPYSDYLQNLNIMYMNYCEIACLCSLKPLWVMVPSFWPIRSLLVALILWIPLVFVSLNYLLELRLVDFGGIRFRVSLTFVVSLVPFAVLIAMANRRIGSLALQIWLCSAGHYCYLHSLPHKMHLHCWSLYCRPIIQWHQIEGHKLSCWLSEDFATL